MKDLQTCTDKNILEHYLRHFPQLNYYHLGDLDGFFWPDTRWYVWPEFEQIQAVVLLYTAVKPVVLLAILNDNQPQLSALLERLIPQLPQQVYAHLSPGLEQLFASEFSCQHHGEHFKMVLTNPAALQAIDTSTVISLGEGDLPRLARLYQESYPGNWFNSRMLKTGQYVGIQDQSGRLLCAAGVHVYSPEYRVAALGNITTLPAWRGQGLATTAAAGLCKQLQSSVDLIGLNVRSDNLAAIHAYQKAGFKIAGIYHEWMLARK